MENGKWKDLFDSKGRSPRRDAHQVEYRFKGGDWRIVATLTRSPGTFNIVPTTPGEAQTVEIRAIFIVNNKPFSQYSTIYSTVIKP